MSEAELQEAVEELAGWLGWRTWHDHDSRRNRAGLPDLVAVHHRQQRVIFAELKTARGRLRPEQEAWRADLIAAGVEYFLWRPADWLDGTIERALKGKP